MPSLVGLNGIGREVVDAGIAVHRELDPGLLETVYEVVLRNESHANIVQQSLAKRRRRARGVKKQDEKAREQNVRPCERPLVGAIHLLA